MHLVGHRLGGLDGSPLSDQHRLCIGHAVGGDRLMITPRMMGELPEGLAQYVFQVLIDENPVRGLSQPPVDSGL